MKINKRKFSTVCGIGIVSLLVVSALMTACATPTSVPTPTPTPTPTPETKILKIGATWGLTGPGSEQQLMSRNVEQLCADWLNEKGGITIKGQKYNIELAVEDNKMNPAGGVDAATKLIYQDKVKFIAGGIIPTVVSAIASVAEKNKVLYVSGRTAMVFPDQTYTFASNYGFAAPVPFLWDVLMEKYSSVKSVGFIAEDEPGGQAVQKLSEEIATKKYGLKVTQTLIHPFEKPEYSAEWTRMMIALQKDLGWKS